MPEPRKLLPKSTLVGLLKLFPDCDVVESVLCKNEKLKELRNEGHTLGLVFMKTKGDFKYAVIRISPEIRASIQRELN